LDNSSYAEGDNGVSSKEKEGDELVNQDVLLPVLHPENQDNTGFPCKLVSNRVTSHEYDTPIVVLLEGSNSMGSCFDKEKKWQHLLITLVQKRRHKKLAAPNGNNDDHDSFSNEMKVSC
jgi:hypothetical protein